MDDEMVDVIIKLDVMVQVVEAVEVDDVRDEVELDE